MKHRPYMNTWRNWASVHRFGSIRRHNQQGPFWLPAGTSETEFPDASLALTEPDGLLAAGGDLSLQRLLNAYRKGIFPWYSDGQPILWWSPDPRMVLYPEKPKISRSLRKVLRQQRFELSYDRAFEEVIRACAEPRREDAGTWITAAMKQAYTELYRLGHAHSVECCRTMHWQEDCMVYRLAGYFLASPCSAG